MLRFTIHLLLLVILVAGLAIALAAIPASAQPTTSVPYAGWEEIGAGSATGGGISNSGGSSQTPSIAFGADGHPIVAWEDWTSEYPEIYVRRWNGSSWAEMGAGSASGGGISNTSYTSSGPQLVVGADGVPVIAWEDNSTPDRAYAIYVRRWNGSAWVEMGSGSASGWGMSQSYESSYWPALTVGPDGMPVVAWPDSRNGYYEIYVRRWNGSAWVQFGNSATGGGDSHEGNWMAPPALAIGIDGNPIVAWEDSITGDAEIYLRRWNGSSWAEMGTASATGGGISNNDASSHSPSLVVDSQGRPVIAWRDDSSGVAEIYVRRWNGSSWAEMGAGSDSGGGISNSGEGAYFPSLAVSSNGTLTIAWSDRSGGDAEIYIRSWNGFSWEPTGNSTASGGGISDSSGGSYDPSLAISQDNRLVVAWSDGTIGNNEIYVRRAPINVLFLPSVSYVPCLLADAEVEPNNTPGQATGALCPNRPYQGQPDRYDVFYLDAQAGALAVNLSNYPADSDVQLQLHYQVVTTNAIRIDQNGADGYHVELPNASAGRYYIVISNPSSPAADSPFILMVDFQMSR